MLPMILICMLISILIAFQMLTFNPRSITEVRKFGNFVFTEGGQDSDHFALSKDLMAIGIASEFDITIANATNSANHGVAELFTTIISDVDGDEEHIRMDGYGANLMSMMYTRRNAYNYSPGAIEANIICRFCAILPCQIPSTRGENINLDMSFNTELVVDDTGANIVINEGTIESYAIFGAINDETWVLRGADNFGITDFEKVITGKDKFIEQVAFYGDEEDIAAMYTVIDQLTAFIGDTKLINLNTLSMVGWGCNTIAPICNSDQFLIAAQNLFVDSDEHRGLLVPYPTTKIEGNLQNNLDRAAADNVFTTALLSMPVAKGGEKPLSKKAEPTTLKRSLRG